MSISHYTIYATNCIDLARSIVIKSDAVAQAMNRIDKEINAVYVATGRPAFYNEYDKRTWRYYMNLAGKYHPLDIGQYTHYNPVTQQHETTDYIKIYSIDTHELIDLTTENLRDHRATLREYRKGSTYYQKLVDKYPTKRLLIDGILSPINIDKAIDARENEIIYYDKTLVEENEFHLILRIQQYIDIFFKRWDNEDYALVDNLYIPARLAILYIYLPYAIMTFRYEASRSIEAHTFHVWNYLGSHQWLDEYKYHLNLYQRMWFYRNIRWSEHNAGKLSTFRKHIDVIMTNRNLPIAEFYSRKNFEGIDNDREWFVTKPYFEMKPLNLADQFAKSDKYREPSVMVDKEVSEARDNILDNNVKVDKIVAEEGFRDNPDNSIPTKVVESRVADQSKRVAIKRDDVDLNEWIYMTTKGLYTARISISNPTNAEYMNMTQREALIVFVYATMKSYGLTPGKIPTITATKVLKLKKPPLEKVRALMDGKITSYTYAHAADHYVFEPERIISTEAFAEFCERVWKLRNLHRNLYSFTYDYREHAQVKSMTMQYYDTVTCKLTDYPTTFEAYFKLRGWKLWDTDEETRTNKGRWSPSLYNQLAADVVKYATGNDLVQRMSVKEIQGMMVRLLRKLSSYSIQLLKDTVEEDVTPMDWPYMRYSKLGKKGHSLEYTNLNTLNFVQHRIIAFHEEKEQYVLGKPIVGSNGTVRGRGNDSVDLVLNLDNVSKARMRTIYRLPSVSMRLIRQEGVVNSVESTFTGSAVSDEVINDTVLYTRYN